MEDDFDLVLEDAVKSYAAMEPSPDLAERILRRAQMLSVLRRRRMWQWALAVSLPAAACLALALALVGRLALPWPPAVVASLPAAPAIVVAAPVSHSAGHLAAGSVPRSWTARRAFRRLPDPYPAQELALLTLVQQHPKEAVEIAEAQKHNADPLRQESIAIAPLQIKPLSIAALN